MNNRESPGGKEKMSLSKSIRKITVLRGNAKTGTASPVVIYERKESKKKSRNGLTKMIERGVRQAAQVQRDVAGEYVARHEKSAKKKKDGWMIDLPQNIQRATRKGVKKMSRLPMP